MCKFSTTKRNGKIIGYQLRIDSTGKGVFLNAGLYHEDDAQDCRLIMNEIERVNKIGSSLGSDWVERIEARQDFRNRLAKAGLYTVKREYKFEELFKLFTASKDLKKSTITAKRISVNRISEIVGDRPVTEWNQRTASKIVEQLRLEYEYAETTISATIRDAKAIFNHAIKEGLLKYNPFESIKSSCYINSERLVYVELEQFQRLLNACDSQEWRVLLTLARIGGLRCPSECFQLLWRDVDFQKGTIRVESPKTARYGRAFRIIPLFPSLRIELQRLKESNQITDSNNDEEVLAHILSRDSANLGRVIKRLATRAGLVLWTRPFQNLRASASTDIFNAFGAIADKVWLGHNPKVSIDHYQSITPAVFSRASLEGFTDKSLAQVC